MHVGDAYRCILWLENRKDSQLESSSNFLCHECKHSWIGLVSRSTPPSKVTKSFWCMLAMLCRNIRCLKNRKESATIERSSNFLCHECKHSWIGLVSRATTPSKVTKRFWCMLVMHSNYILWLDYRQESATWEFFKLYLPRMLAQLGPLGFKVDYTIEGNKEILMHVSYA